MLKDKSMVVIDRLLMLIWSFNVDNKSILFADFY